ncbi:hypothetical protein [Phenylobacterium sp.]|uniref:hypothetical protein n=1 Tax=Phenylobacterium sp. TaxID=1871053 RepID=UPI00289C545A|nr:hypothetical protein [Phenylobacterium sp.]
MAGRLPEQVEWNARGLAEGWAKAKRASPPPPHRAGGKRPVRPRVLFLFEKNGVDRLSFVRKLEQAMTTYSSRDALLVLGR